MEKNFVYVHNYLSISFDKQGHIDELTYLDKCVFELVVHAPFLNTTFLVGFIRKRALDFTQINFISKLQTYCTLVGNKNQN